MRIIVNDEPRAIPDGTTVAALVEHLGLAGSPCAVEVNNTLVPKAERDETTLHENDRVEIVSLVGGG